MHYLRGTNYLAAKRLANRLMSEANAHDRDAAGKALNHLQGNARVIRRAWSRRNHNALWLQLRFDLINRDLIIPPHFDLLTQFAKILDQVVGKRVVVVDN